MPLEAALPAGGSPAIGRNWQGRMFLLLSAIAHIAAAVALSISWARSPAESKAAPVASHARPENPQVVRLAIDVAPPKLCEMKIEKLVGQAEQAPKRLPATDPQNAAEGTQAGPQPIRGQPQGRSP